MRLTGRHVAPVVGNSAYVGAPLLNPANDARAMGDTLRGLGFTVVELRDGQKDQMTDAIAKVLDACRDNPFSAMASGKGLAQLDAPQGSTAAIPVQQKVE